MTLLRPGPSRQRRHLCLSGLASRLLHRSRQTGALPDLGQRLLAHQSGGSPLDQDLQSPSQTRGWLSLDCLSATQQESLVEPHRTQVGAWQARSG